MKAILLVFSLIFTINAQSMKLHRLNKKLFLGSYLLGEMPLNNNNYFQYYGNFSLGTPAQKNITFILDTSSTDMWVAMKGGAYNSSASTTANISQQNGTITVFLNILSNIIKQYGTGYVQGYIGKEVLGQNQLFLSNVTVPLLFETAQVNMSTIYTTGMIGLSNNKHYKNFIELAVEQGYLNNSIFAFEVQNIYGTSDFYVSSLSFPSRLNLTYYNCSRSDYWTIRIKSTVIAETTYTQEYNAQEALISSGTSTIMIGTSALTALQNQLNGLCQIQKGFYICDCTDKSLFPYIYFNTELQTTLQVAPNAYLLPVQLNNLQNIFQKQGTGEFCTLGVTASSYPFMIFGDVFMKNYFISFDKSNNKIGISIPSNP